MGFISKLVSTAKNVTSKVVSNIPIIGKTVAPQVISSVTAPSPKTGSPVVNTALKVAAVTTSPSTVSLAKQTAVATGIVTTGAASILAPATSLGIIKSVIPKTTTGKVAAVIAAPAGVALVANSPKLQEDILNIPAASSAFGKDVATVYENPTLETTKDLILGHPIAAAVTGAAALTAVGIGVKSAIPAVVGLTNTAATKENTKAIETSLISPTANTPQVIPVKAEIPKSSPIPTSSTVPLTPATQVVGKSVSSSRKVRSRKLTKKSNTPSVRVTINNQTKTLNTYSHRRICYG